ncbi:MAG: hypothetical protein JSV18_02785 [Candidatus Bathyarchaeota archaeon]|nr:MAG: hypothetical protein JSV18_02785 [Candidatus Bathyarchaeota archaeon]
MQEESTTCQKCGKEVPRTQFCIYCGYNLVERGRRPSLESSREEPPIEAYKPPKIRPQPDVDDTSFFSSLYDIYKEERRPPPLIDLGVDPELTHLTKEMVKHHAWKVKLCELLMEEGLQERVFTNIYEGYQKEIAQLKERIEEKTASYRDQYEEKKAELEKTNLKLEELRVRVAIGELAESDLLIRTPSIRENINTIEKEITRLEKTTKQLSNQPLGVTRQEQFEHEQTARKFIKDLDTMVEGGKLSRELAASLAEDFEDTINLFAGMVSDETERELRNELDVLEVRFKVGEITQSELDSLRSDVLSKLERFWKQ